MSTLEAFDIIVMSSEEQTMEVLLCVCVCVCNVIISCDLIQPPFGARLKHNRCAEKPLSARKRIEWFSGGTLFPSLLFRAECRIILFVPLIFSVCLKHHPAELPREIRWKRSSWYGIAAPLRRVHTARHRIFFLSFPQGRRPYVRYCTFLWSKPSWNYHHSHVK